MAPQKQKAPASSSWDPILLISQIVSMQTLHYLTLSILIPPLLSLFAEPASLNYEGGAANIGMIMDWREMAGRPTVRGMQLGERWWAWIGGKRVGYGDDWIGMGTGGMDPKRGWIIAICWLAACGVDIYYVYTLIRRPRLILDFAGTLVFNHLVLTTYYSASLPTSLFFYLVLFGGATLTLITAEQLCVKREMREGLSVKIPAQENEDGEVEEMEMGELGMRRID